MLTDEPLGWPARPAPGRRFQTGPWLGGRAYTGQDCWGLLGGFVSRRTVARTIARGFPMVAGRELTDGEVAQEGRSPRASACEAGDGPGSDGGDGRVEAPQEVPERGRPPMRGGCR